MLKKWKKAMKRLYATVGYRKPKYLTGSNMVVEAPTNKKDQFDQSKDTLGSTDTID